MRDVLDTYLAELEASVRRRAGKRHATRVVSEFREHLNEAVTELEAAGRSEGAAMNEAIANLGRIDPWQLVPTDGAPPWFNRTVRNRIAFWTCVVISSLFPWVVYASFPTGANYWPFVLLGTSLVVLPTVGCFGARWIILPVVKGALVSLATTSVAMSFCFVTIVDAGRPHLALRSAVASEQRAAIATWNSHRRPDQIELERITRVSNFYRQPRPDPARLPAEGRGSGGGFRYPTGGGWNWRNETPSFELATKRWREAGVQAVKVYESGVLRHDEQMKSGALALGAPWFVNLVPSTKAVAEFLMLTVPWFVLCSLFGDIVRSLGLLLARLLTRNRAASG